ncbi:hypothetical protein SAMN05216436_10214 [bacterium A37T11]|nr:hypothetical protein SAMN05216436_10214 [bacterium A37T11]
MRGRPPFSYIPGEHELEQASNSYLMSLVALIAGLPLPIINLIATLVFFIGNRKGSYFVRWHCTQALLSQFSLLLVNSTGFYWTMSILFGPVQVSNHYIAYMLTIILFNLAELYATIYTAMQVRKGIHIAWWFYGGLTQLICKP